MNWYPRALIIVVENYSSWNYSLQFPNFSELHYVLLLVLFRTSFSKCYECKKLFFMCSILKLSCIRQQFSFNLIRTGEWLLICNNIIHGFLCNSVLFLKHLLHQANDAIFDVYWWSKSNLNVCHMLSSMLVLQSLSKNRLLLIKQRFTVA